ncbi:hypothetical protein Tco_1062644 [Tanacetum coccineum]
MKQEVSMAIPMEDGSGYTKERIRKVDTATMDKPKDGFTEVSSRKKKGKKVDINQPKTRPISGIRLTKPKPSFYRPVSKHDTNKSGADLDPKVQVGADASKKASDTSTLC